MNYAVRTNDVFETRKPLKTRRDATPDQKRTRRFAETHTISVDIDRLSGEPVIHVGKRDS
jgi:hypothetical protein